MVATNEYVNLTPAIVARTPDATRRLTVRVLE
jgi:hypothetical protein